MFHWNRKVAQKITTPTLKLLFLIDICVNMRNSCVFYASDVGSGVYSEQLRLGRNAFDAVGIRCHIQLAMILFLYYFRDQGLRYCGSRTVNAVLMSFGYLWKWHLTKKAKIICLITFFSFLYCCGE